MVTLSAASLHVFTFKEGMLARLGHDLRLSIMRFDVSAEQGRVKASVDLNSLAVDGALKNGSLDAHELDASDREKILEHARRDVLDVARHGEAVFEAEVQPEAAEHFLLSGTLRLHGASRPLKAQVKRQGAQLVASAELKPSDWGIAPCRALAGAIRVQDRVRIELLVSLPQGVDANTLGGTPLSFRSP